MPVHLMILAHLQLHEKSNAASNNIFNFESLCYKQRSYMVQEHSSNVLAIYSRSQQCNFFTIKLVEP
jgi:hypothetical protein